MRWDSILFRGYASILPPKTYAEFPVPVNPVGGLDVIRVVLEIKLFFISSEENKQQNSIPDVVFLF